MKTKQIDIENIPFILALKNIGWSLRWIGMSYYTLVDANGNQTKWRLRENSDEMDLMDCGVFGRENNGFIYIKLNDCSFSYDESKDWVYLHLKIQRGLKNRNKLGLGFRGKKK